MSRPGWERNYRNLERKGCDSGRAEGKVERSEVVLYYSVNYIDYMKLFV